MKLDRIKRKRDGEAESRFGDVFDGHTYGAEDERECSMMRHQILAGIHRSNAPAWLAEELEKRLYCQGCWIAVANR